MVETIDNRRREPRFYVPLDVRIDDCPHTSDTLENISLRGCCIDSSQQYEAERVMLVNFFDLDDSFCMPAKVRWKVPSGTATAGITMHRYGIEFINSQSPFFMDQRETFVRVMYSQMRKHRKKTTTRISRIIRNQPVVAQ